MLAHGEGRVHRGGRLALPAKPNGANLRVEYRFIRECRFHGVSLD
jgi:hypothetical protein